MVDELVAGDADEPRHRELRNGVALDGPHRGKERFGREVFGERVASDAGPQVAEHLRQRAVIDLEQCRTAVWHRYGAHTPIIVRNAWFRRAHPNITRPARSPGARRPPSPSPSGHRLVRTPGPTRVVTVQHRDLGPIRPK